MDESASDIRGAARVVTLAWLSPGLTANNTDYEIWGRVLASHGIVALLMQPTSTSDWNDARAVDLKAALSVVRGGLNASGPLAGKLDTAHVGFMGQSMGGGGTLIAANEVGDDIQAAIPMEPYAPGVSFPKITAPTLIIAAELDSVEAVSRRRPTPPAVATPSARSLRCLRSASSSPGSSARRTTR